jgi:uncharacterized protein YgiM (DUF1202 family)
MPNTPTPQPTPTLASAESTPVETPALESSAVGQVEILAWGLKVRTGPGIDQPLLGHLSQGEVVPILSVDPATGWLEVELPTGETGWITGSETYVAVRE